MNKGITLVMALGRCQPVSQRQHRYAASAATTDGTSQTVLMPSTPFASPQVISRRFTLFGAPGIGVSAGHTRFCAEFDSRQLH
jgi:hypothetical protein